MVHAGFRVVVPDQRGYGGSSIPSQVTDYDILHLTGDLVGLLDSIGEEKAVFVGHDWGGIVVWQMALLHPERVAGVVGVNTPHLPRPPVPPVKLLKEAFGESHYIVWFQKPGEADAVLGADVRGVFRALMRKGVPPEVQRRAATEAGSGSGLLAAADAGEPLMPEDELEVYVRTFENTGFTGGINWYRNLDRNWELTADVDQHVRVPALMVTAEWDAFLPPSLADGMTSFVEDLTRVDIRGCGHWTQQEKPEELSRAMVDWLVARFGRT